ncbi:fibroleukin isoform X2 [Magallana gigas]|uniref:fibroleukin isoform X2 n=1 Tax=Magallana gigas TaxID=29159 RepID=UPI00333E3B96
MDNSAMGRLFGILILTSLLVSLNGQVLFDDMGDRQRSTDLALQCMRTELQQFSQGIEKMVTKKLKEVENVIETKVSNMIETKTTNLSRKVEKISDLITTTQTEQRLLKQEMESFTSKTDTMLNNCETKISNLSRKVQENSDLITTTQTEQRLLKQEMESLNFKAETNCADILNNYPHTRGRDGVYNIFDSNKSKAVFCDMTTDNGGWTVIQRRVNGSVDFYRNWTEYKNGFGFADHEYWIGNDMLHRLTLLKPQELRVDMERFNGEKAYAVYSSFSVGDEASKYQLQVTGYSGNAGDSLDYSKNSCHNNDNDQ